MHFFDTFPSKAKIARWIDRLIVCLFDFHFAVAAAVAASAVHTSVTSTFQCDFLLQYFWQTVAFSFESTFLLHEGMYCAH